MGLLRAFLFVCVHVHSHYPPPPLFPSKGQMPEEPTEVYLPSKPGCRGLAHRAVSFPWESLSLPSPQCLPFIPTLGVGILIDTQTVILRSPQPEGGHLWADLRCYTMSGHPCPHIKRLIQPGARDRDGWALSPHSMWLLVLFGSQICNQSLKGIDSNGFWHTRKIADTFVVE